MKLKLWQIDAFASHALEGNPAAVVPLDTWIDAGLMGKIAGENNLSETAFFVKTAPGRYDLRWFTPAAEVDLCGHATLASAWLVFADARPRIESRFLPDALGRIDRHARPRRAAHDVAAVGQGCAVRGAGRDSRGTSARRLALRRRRNFTRARYLLAVWDDAKTVRAIKGANGVARVLRSAGIWGLIATAKGDEGYDFVSRFFAPDKGVPEDPVTGSAHCALTPFWAKRLSKKTMKARQVSPRGGDLTVTDEGARAVISGSCALYMTGEIEV